MKKIKELFRKNINAVSTVSGVLAGYAMNRVVDQFLTNRYPLTNIKGDVLYDTGASLIKMALSFETGLKVREDIQLAGRLLLGVDNCDSMF